LLRFECMDETSEILKSGAITHLTDLLTKLAGPAFEELGAVFADNVRVYRVKNLIKTSEKTKRMLQDAGLQPKPVPSRLLLPILDTCSVEDNDDLQERWAGLLASASQEGDSLSPSFTETLKQLTPAEAKHYDHVFAEAVKYRGRIPTTSDAIPHWAFTKAGGAPRRACETYERLGLIRRDYSVKIDSHRTTIEYDPKDIEETINNIDSAFDDIDADVEFCYCFTVYSLEFLKACRGPRPTGKQVQDNGA
jgi:hypothetical protein